MCSQQNLLRPYHVIFSINKLLIRLSFSFIRCDHSRKCASKMKMLLLLVVVWYLHTFFLLLFIQMKILEKEKHISADIVVLVVLYEMYNKSTIDNIITNISLLTMKVEKRNEKSI